LHIAINSLTSMNRLTNNADWLPSARIIARPKLTGFGEHWGVQLPNGYVAHHTQTGEKLVTLEQFSEGRPVKEIIRVDPAQNIKIVQRAMATTQHPSEYRLLDRNCETYATWLVGEKPHSPQVLGVAILGAIVIGAAILQ
jgi:Lecithin retinol acyltransferase